jgi:hypothetical protein
MAIVLSNGVTNINGTPGINSDVFANRPAATDVAPGSIYIATDTGVIYQSNGATWSTIGGGGSTPGIDSVLAVGQALTAIRTINQSSFGLLLSNTNNTSRFNDTGASIFNLSTIGFTVSTESTAKGVFITDLAIAQKNYLNLDIQNDIYKIGDFINTTNGNTFIIDNANDLVYLQNKGITNGLYFDFSNKAYKFGRLNSGSEQSIEVDEVNSFTFAKDNGIINGFNLDFSATVFQFGFLDNTVTPDTYININGNSETIQAVYNGNDNGLNLNFNASSRLFQLGDYQGNFNSTKINLDDNATSILISSSQTAGSTTIEGNSLVFTGANLESATSSGTSGQHLVITLNGVVYHIDLKNP